MRGRSVVDEVGVSSAGAAFVVALLILGAPLAWAQEGEIPILGVVAEVTLPLDVTTFVENTSLNSLPAAGGRVDSCGTDTRFVIVSSTRFLFRETSVTSTECGELGLRFTPPEGVRSFRVVFSSNRTLLPPTDQRFPTNGEEVRFGSNAAQEMHVSGDDQVVFLTRDLFAPTSRDSPFVNFSVPVDVPEGSDTVNLTWYFDERGPITVVQSVPNVASTDTFIAAVDSPQVIIPDYPTTFGSVVNQTSVRNGDELTTTTLYAVATPQVAGAVDSPALRIRLSATANFTHIRAPDGARIERSQVNRTISAEFADVFLPSELVAAHGNGTYAIAIVTRGTAPPLPPPPGPVSLFPLAFFLIATPVLPAALAVRSTLAFSRRAPGRFQSTSRFVWLALAGLMTIYAATAAFVLLAPRWRLMESLPLPPEGLLLDGIFVALTLALATLWFVPARFARRALEADLEERRKAELKFRGLLEAAPDGIVLVDSRDTIVLVNKQAERLFGRARDEIVGGPIGAVVPTPFEGGVFAAVSSHIGVETLELRARRSDGTEFPIEVTLSPIETAEGPLVAAAVRDVTERKRTEAELHRSNSELEHFAYIASHDLQEPLRTISGFAQLLESRYSETLDDRGKRYIERTVAGSQRMQVLINDLLSYSRVQTQGQPFAPVDLNASVDVILTDLESILSAAGARVTRDALPTVSGDASQLGQVFSNLIRNSVKYRHPDRPPVVAITAERSNAVWRVSVRDNGIGIAREYHDKVFVIFQRLQPRGDASGTGLGLAITKRIVERHGGHIWIESEPGEGATFHFTLPDAGEPRP